MHKRCNAGTDEKSARRMYPRSEVLFLAACDARYSGARSRHHYYVNGVCSALARVYVESEQCVDFDRLVPVQRGRELPGIEGGHDL